MVITGSALSGLGCGAGHRADSVIRGEHGVGVHSEVIGSGLAVPSKGERKIFALAVAPCKGKTYVGASVPALQQARVQRFLVRNLLGLVTQRRYGIFRDRNRTLFSGFDFDFALRGLQLPHERLDHPALRRAARWSN